MADVCSWRSAQAETPTHVKCHSTNFFSMQRRYNRRGERQTHLIAPQNEILRRFCNSQIYRLYFNGIQSILSLLLCAQLYADCRNFGQHMCNIIYNAGQEFSSSYRERGIVRLFISRTAAPFKLRELGLYDCCKLFLLPLVT